MVLPNMFSRKRNCCMDYVHHHGLVPCQGGGSCPESCMFSGLDSENSLVKVRERLWF